MFGTKNLIDELNDLIDGGGLSDIELSQAFAAIESIRKRGVSVVSVEDELPDAATNKGRFFYVMESNRYVMSDGSTWSNENIATKSAPNLLSWGNNGNGRLGDNTSTSKSSPILVVGGFTNWIQVSAQGAHSLGLRADGTVWAWGSNGSGRLGDNTTTDRSSPVSVIGGFTDWISVSAGETHSLGLRANGTLWAWGSNSNGALLGHGAFGNRSSPVSVVGGFTDWIYANAGSIHSLGIRANGTAWAWGSNQFAKLGDGTETTRSSPVSVIGGFTDWISVSAGETHSLGLRANGTLWAWGFNGFGQLGDNTTTDRSSPVSVVGGFTDWISMIARSSHSLGLRANGTLWSWGSNTNGRLGDNTTTQRISPVSVVGGFTDWIQVSAGGTQSIGLRANGTAWAWGLNTSGQLGDDSTSTRSSPVSVVGGFTDWISVSAGDTHSAAIRAT